MTLRAYQQTMANYLRDITSTMYVPVTSPGHQVDECLEIYRNHYFISLTDGIAATFPATRRYLGQQAFHTKARSFVVAHPPESGCLADYGNRFPDWLVNEKPEAAELARLEWSLERVGMAPLPNPFPFQRLAGLTTEQYEKVHFDLAIGVCVFEANWDVIFLYDQINNNESFNKDCYSPGQHSWLLYRKPEGVGVYPVDKIFTKVLTICQSGQSLSTLGDALSQGHIEAIFSMVDKGIIDGFNLFNS